MEERKILAKLDSRKRPGFSVERILYMYFFVGILIFLTSVLFLLFKKLETNFSHVERMSFIMAVGGFLITIFSGFAALYKKNRNKNESYSDYMLLAFLRKWNDFEKTLSDVLRDVKDKSLRSNIELLRENKIIDEIDAAILYSSVQMRNKIIHSNDEIDLEKSQFFLESLGEVTKKIISNNNSFNFLTPGSLV